jgi:hypothetical protein
VNIRRSHSRVLNLPVLVNSSEVPSEEQCATFGVHHYGPDIRATEDFLSPEMCGVLKTLFPVVYSLKVHRLADNPLIALHRFIFLARFLPPFLL